MRADYLGGLRDAPVTKPVGVEVIVDAHGFRFDVSGGGDMVERGWGQVAAVRFSDPAMASETRGSVVGTMLFGVVGLAMKSRSYSALLIGTTADGEEFGFAVAGASPLGLRSQLTNYVPQSLLEERQQAAPSGARRWEHQIVDLSAIGSVGDDGWEAVSVFQHQNASVVLVKRPR